MQMNIHKSDLEKLIHLSQTDTFINHVDMMVCKKLLDELDSHPIWEPDPVGEKAQARRTAHLYSILNKAYRIGIADAREDVVETFKTLIWEGLKDG